MAWNPNDPGEEISRSLPLPIVENGIEFDSSEHPTLGDQYVSGSAPEVSFEYNRSWETHLCTNLVAYHTHAWLLGQLKNVCVVEAFSPYESDKILMPVFESEDDSKLSQFAQFSSRPGKLWLEDAELERKREELKELLNVITLSLFFFGGVRLRALSKRFSERGFRSTIFKV